MDCINLKETFGDRYRITFDHAYNPKGRHKLDPWMMMVACRLGNIYPQGGDMLAADVDGNHPGIKAKLVRAGFDLHRDGDDGFTILFPISRFDEVAQLIKPNLRRKPNLTPEQRQARSQRMKEIRRKPQNAP